MRQKAELLHLHGGKSQMSPEACMQALQGQRPGRMAQKRGKSQEGDGRGQEKAAEGSYAAETDSVLGQMAWVQQIQ